MHSNLPFAVEAIIEEWPLPGRGSDQPYFPCSAPLVACQPHHCAQEPTSTLLQAPALLQVAPAWDRESAAAAAPARCCQPCSALARPLDAMDFLTEEDLELLEPAPDIHALFVHYNELYFEGRLGACSGALRCMCCFSVAAAWSGPAACAPHGLCTSMP